MGVRGRERKEMPKGDECGQRPVVAAHTVLQFFRRPGFDTFDALCAAARKAGCVKAIRAATMRFLETGCCPVEIVPTEDGENGENCTAVNVDENWPLPVPHAIEAEVVAWIEERVDLVTNTATAKLCAIATCPSEPS